MNLDWRVKALQLRPTSVHVTATVPEIVVEYDPSLREQWRSMRRQFLASGKKDWSTWGQYSTLARSGRCRFPDREDSSYYGWAEAHIAHLMAAHGFESWTTALLFRREGRRVRQEQRQAGTVDVEKLLSDHGYPLPNTLRADVYPKPKNPDLVLYNPESKEWRFCEVKRAEKVQREQVNALALLHILTGAPVAIVRLVPEGRRWKARQHRADFVYRGPLDITSRIRARLAAVDSSSSASGQ